MSLIQCPECGGMISDTAPSCPHCGMDIDHCKECDALLPSTAKFCPQCGKQVKLATSQIYEVAAKQQRKYTINNRRKLFSFILLVGVCVLLFTCPSKEQHEKVVNNIVQDAVEDITDSLGRNNEWINFESKVIYKFAEQVIKNNLDVSNYWFFSVSKINNNQMLSFGIGGHVFCFINKDDIKQIINKWLEKQKRTMDSSLPGF